LPGMAGQLATVWSLIAGAPLSKERGDEPPVIPDEAIRGVRRTMDEMTGSYLTRRGKKRYCDKSLGTARFAELLLRIYPEAKFLCLYRHPMDVIASAIEACPWGLRGYGFDQYVASTPGNTVWALARFWVDNASIILEAEERFSDCSCRLRYEDLVADPEGAATRIFEFLGVSQAPGISSRCFAPDRERSGPADYKIWHTSQITTDSVGRGWSVPAGMIPPPVREQINELAGKLGYLPVDERWGTAVLPAGLYDTDGPGLTSGCSARPPAEVAMVRDRLTAGLSRMDDQFIRDWGSYTTESFTVAALPPSGSRANGAYRWRVDLGARAVTDEKGGTTNEDDTTWDIVGSTEAWSAVLSGRTNLGVAMRRCDLRYCDDSDGSDAGQPGPEAADARIGLLAELLGLGASWRSRERAAREPTGR
jgi:hypothetical protein